MSPTFSYSSAGDAVKVIRSGHRVFVQGGAATPSVLLQAMANRKDELQDVEVIHIHLEGESYHTADDCTQSFKDNSLFIGANVRKCVQEGKASYIPIFLSDIPLLFRNEVLPIDVAMVQVSPPDSHGFCSLGVSVDITLSAVETAQYVIAQINPNMPRTFGDGIIHIRRFEAVVEVDKPLFQMHIPEPDDQEIAIGEFIANLVEDGATLQMGIGGIPNAALKLLAHHKNLGIHTEMFSDGIVDLVEKGAVTGVYKKIQPGKIVSGFAMGSQRLFNFMHDNPSLMMMDTGFVNDTAIIRQNPKVTAINSAIEIDITGQICSDSIGMKMYSGVGGQMDFIRGASLSYRGKPIIALKSTTHDGQSKIVPLLKEGAGVVTTRAHARYIVTEYGVADLFGKNLAQRAKALIHIAHPAAREKLEKAARQRYGKSLGMW